MSRKRRRSKPCDQGCQSLAGASAKRRGEMVRTERNARSEAPQVADILRILPEKLAGMSDALTLR